MKISSHFGVLLLLAMLTGMAPGSGAAWLRVPDDHTTLTAALALAQPGDTITVAAGIYAPSTNGEVFPLVVPAGVHVRGAGMGLSILDAESTASVIRILDSGSGQVLAGFTITGGNALRGGGVQIEAGSPEIAHNLILANGALNRGSGINVQGDAAPWIHHNVVWENFDLDLAHVGDPHGIQCGIDSAGLIEHNLVGRTDSNGLLTQEQAAPTIRHNIFFDNGIEGLRGRGICNFGGPSTVIAHNLFFANKIAALVMRDAQGTIRNMSAQEADAEFAQDGLYGNLDADPLLSDVDALDFRLLEGSPAIDAGDPLVATDPDGSAPDLGPFPYGATVSAPTITALAIEMLGNVPNPFNPATEIHFVVHRDTTVRVTVSDVRGRQVRTLVSAALAAGSHTVRWDGTDDRGDPVASGVYLARATAAGESAIAPMVLVR
jgi:hypothetical protein